MMQQRMRPVVLGAIIKMKVLAGSLSAFLLLSCAQFDENYSNEPDYQFDQVMTLYRSGLCKEAAPLGRRIVEAKEKGLGPGHPSLGSMNHNLALVLKCAGDYDRAELHYRKALQIFESNLGKDHPQLAETLNNLGSLYYAKGDFKRAKESLVEAIRIAEKTLAPGDERLLRLTRNLSEIDKTIDEQSGGRRPAAAAEEAVSDPSGKSLTKGPSVTGGATGPGQKEIEDLKKQQDEKDEPRVKAAPPSLQPDHAPARESPELQQVQGPGQEKQRKEARSEKPDLQGAAVKPKTALSYPYSLYLGSFQTLTLAKRALGIYRAKNVSAYWVKVDLGEKGIWYRVYTGFFEGRAQAQKSGQDHGLEEAEVRKVPYANLIGEYAPGADYRNKLTELEQLDYSPYLIPYDNGIVRLFVGAFLLREGSEACHQELLSRGIKNQIVER